MATLKIILRTTHKKNDGTFPIVFRLTENRQSKIIVTGFAVKENQFKDGIVIKHPDSVLINNAIEIKRSALMANIINANVQGIDVDLGKKEPTLFNAIDKLLNHYEAKGMAASFNRMLTNKRILKEVLGNDVKLSKIDKSHIDKYIEYRYNTGNGAATVRKNLQDLSTVLTFVDYTGKNYFKLAMKAQHPEPVNREKLTLTEIEILENIKLEGLNDLARDMFLFSYYCHGMRFESVAIFDKSMISEGFIHYRMNKGKKMRQIEIHGKLGAIIYKYSNNETMYLFPLIKKVHDNWSKKEIIGTGNVVINTHLKRVAIMAGIDKKISMHMARHSFATNAVIKGVSHSVLKDALGHSSYATTEKYLKSLSDKNINDAVKVMWD
jgi:integrase/recombinase XerD